MNFKVVEKCSSFPAQETLDLARQSPPTVRPETESRTSMTSSRSDICRICHCEAEENLPLISPCRCAGSLKWVHQGCLQQWIKSADTKSCELCKFDFVMKTKVKPLTKWEKLDMTAVERRKVFCSVTFHVIAITCVIWSLYVLIDRTTEEIRAGALEWPFWTKLIVVAIGFTGGLVFMYVQCKMYMQLCKRWRAYNRVIYVEDGATHRATIIDMTNITSNKNKEAGTGPPASPDLTEHNVAEASVRVLQAQQSQSNVQVHQIQDDVEDSV